MPWLSSRQEPELPALSCPRCPRLSDNFQGRLPNFCITAKSEHQIGAYLPQRARLDTPLAGSKVLDDGLWMPRAEDDLLAHWQCCCRSIFRGGEPLFPGRAAVCSHGGLWEYISDCQLPHSRGEGQTVQAVAWKSWLSHFINRPLSHDWQVALDEALQAASFLKSLPRQSKPSPAEVMNPHGFSSEPHLRRCHVA